VQVSVAAVLEVQDGRDVLRFPFVRFADTVPLSVLAVSDGGVLALFDGFRSRSVAWSWVVSEGRRREQARYCAFGRRLAWLGGCGAGCCCRANGAGAALFSTAPVSRSGSCCHLGKISARRNARTDIIAFARCRSGARRLRTLGGHCGGGLLTHSCTVHRATART